MSRSNQFLGRKKSIFSEGYKITIHDKGIETLIKDWLESLYWKPSSFKSILEQVGISLPVELSDYDYENNHFICTTSDGKKYTLQIKFGDCDDFPELRVTDEEEVRSYELRFNFDQKSTPVIFLSGRKVKLGNRTITGHYMYMYNWKVEIGNSKLIKVSIRTPRNYQIDAQKCKEAEDYLLAAEVKSTIDVRNLYDVLIDKLSLSNDVVESCEKISIVYSIKEGNDWKVKSKINVEAGYTTEYQIYRQGNIYHLFSNGNWEYVGKDGVNITSDDDVITVSITGNTDKIAETNPYTMLQQAEYVIDLLWSSVW